MVVVVEVVVVLFCRAGHKKSSLSLCVRPAPSEWSAVDTRFVEVYVHAVTPNAFVHSGVCGVPCVPVAVSLYMPALAFFGRSNARLS